jgi:hypothetical protein
VVNGEKAVASTQSAVSSPQSEYPLTYAPHDLSVANIADCQLPTAYCLLLLATAKKLSYHRSLVDAIPIFVYNPLEH